MTKVLVLGSSGMAGHVIVKYLSEDKKLDVYNINDKCPVNDRTVIMDVSNISVFEEYLERNSFDVIINCIGVLNQSAERFKDKAILLNSYLPHFIEQKYAETETRLIHLSTDCVFSGRAGSYTENAFRDGDTFYDRTKAVGEVINDKDLTFRMSIIGPDMNIGGIGLFNWLMGCNGAINGYLNAIWTGVTTIELAKAIKASICGRLTGLYHLVPHAAISKYELLMKIEELFGLEHIIINKFENTLVDKSLINTRKDFAYEIPAYDEMLKEMRDWINNNKYLYPHYFLKE